MLEKILSELQPTKTLLVAVSKTKSAETIREFYDAGQRDFGENYVQELTLKAAILPKDIRWHFIGHLQSNKVKSIAPFIHLIHTVDSLSLLAEIDKQARKYNRVINCLLQFKINEEETKSGLPESEIANFFDSEIFRQAKHVRLVGVMGMSTFTDDNNQITNEFRKLRSLFEMVRSKYYPDDEEFREISMGMSDDYKIAVKEGSTMVRVGSLLFGKR